jgi:formate C-acetyltransferase
MKAVTIDRREIVPGIEPLPAGPLDYNEVRRRFDMTMAHLAENYVSTMNVIHYMHDKYYYERLQLAFMDSEVKRNMAFGIAGLSVAADSLSAIRFAKVMPVRNDQGLTTGFEVIGEFPKYGNDDDRVDQIAHELVHDFNQELGKHHIYRHGPLRCPCRPSPRTWFMAKTVSTPDGRLKGQPFASR